METYKGDELYLMAKLIFPFSLVMERNIVNNKKPKMRNLKKKDNKNKKHTSSCLSALDVYIFDVKRYKLNLDQSMIRTETIVTRFSNRQGN
jgi:hypothetical protein